MAVEAAVVVVAVAVVAGAAVILYLPMHLKTFLAKCEISDLLIFHNSSLSLLMDAGIMGPMRGILIWIVVISKHGQPIMVLIPQTQLPLLVHPLLHLLQLLLLFPTNGGLPVKSQHLSRLLYLFRL